MTTAADPPKLPRRNRESHKGDFGRALLVGGSRGMSGAVALAGMAALRGGAGLVSLAVPKGCLTLVAGFEPSYMTTPLPDDADGCIAAAARHDIAEMASSAACVACGPGLGRSDELTQLVQWMFCSLPTPAVFDADALNALAQNKFLESVDDIADAATQKHARVLTPHLGEFRRLWGRELHNRAAAEEAAHQFAARHGVVLVLKGHETLITDGRQRAVNSTGNPGMATGGSGDVLTGLITALICQRLPAFDAARLGVYWHGLSGDLAAAELGETSLIARDIVDFLPPAARQLRP